MVLESTIERNTMNKLRILLLQFEILEGTIERNTSVWYFGVKLNAIVRYLRVQLNQALVSSTLE